MGAGVLAAMLVACAPELDGKQDASELPAGLTNFEDGGKRDSLAKPLAGGTLRVGQYQEDKFTAQHGWIAYEIELTAGPADVFLHGQAPNYGDALDTILYVYGPKKANGKFPGQVLAFNDDAVPGSDLGSHLLLDVPTDGTYRIVVSSYDNWLYYPTNVTRGDYHVIVKCPRDGGVDACGPAVHYEGGSCWNDGECASGLHCEGEITCLPGTECLIAHPGTCTVDYTWLTYAPHQCGQNPWQENAQPGDGVDSMVTNPEGVEVDNFFESNGIQLLEIGFLHDAVPHVVCLACVCPRGDLLMVKANAADAARLVNEFGFTAATPGQWQEQSPIQCGGNPWDEDADRYQEERNIVAWLGTQSVSLVRVGFVEKTEPYALCRACGCPRGDRLLVSPASPESALALGGLYFADVYRQ
jgi:hypothetical protein